MADGATDVGTREVKDVHVRFLENGEPVSKFAGLKECHKRRQLVLQKLSKKS